MTFQLPSSSQVDETYILLLSCYFLSMLLSTKLLTLLSVAFAGFMSLDVQGATPPKPPTCPVADNKDCNSSGNLPFRAKGDDHDPS